MLWCWLSWMASSPHPLNAITHLTEEELSFFPVPLQKLLCITACLQPETGAARASLPGWAKALPTDKAQPPSPLQGAGSACSKPVLQVCRWGFLMRWILPVQAGCDLEPMRGQCSSRQGPQAATNSHVFAQARANPFPGAGACLSKSLFCAGRLGAVPLLQANEGAGDREGPLLLPLPAESPFRAAPPWAVCKA